jgi:uncharacterized membrane protein YbhN (UPF0104 family)
MTTRFRTYLQYLLIFGATIFLVWFSLQGLIVNGSGNSFSDKWNYLFNTWLLADKGWLFLMAGTSIISHLIRAERWRILLLAAKSNTTLHESFLSLLVGYLVNLVIPRGGEISRCYNLQQLNKTPLELSFGTVIVDRVLDVICLLFIIGLAFLLQTEKLLDFMDSLAVGSNAGESKMLYFALAGGAALLLGVGFFWFLWQKPKWREKIQRILHGFKQGLLSILQLKRPGLFIFYTVVIWLLYFIMSYMVMLAFPSTSVLGLGAVLSIFALGSIAMAAPTPGGAGTYHALVPAGITFLYAIPLADAIAFVFVFHAWQTLIVILAGAISLVVTSFLSKRRRSKPNVQELTDKF